MIKAFTLRKKISPSVYDQEDPIARRHIALRRGPVMLAQENRLGYSVDEPISVKVMLTDMFRVQKMLYNCIVKLDIPLCNGNNIINYALAEKT